MGRRRGQAAVVLLLAALSACTTAGTSTPTPATTTIPATTTTAATTEPPPSSTTPPAPVTSEPPARDPLAFFRAQEAPCAQFAQQVGNPVVEPERFSGATVVRDLGRGATQIVDGRGTRLVVVPQRGIVLPESGRTDAVMPPPYEFGCSEKVFVGAAHD